MKNAAVCVVALSSLALCVGALGVAALAEPRVGVTSATTGGPTGKPPAQAERVLHVGVDVQANEIVTTGANDRAHLLFLDGSSLTVGPQARLTIDRFVYDPNSKSGALAINASQGVFRFVGGKISKTAPVTVTTPSATLTIRGGIMIVSTDANHTVAMFVFGNDMTVTAAGHTKFVTRTGWQVTTYAGAGPGEPVPTPPGSLAAELKQLEAIGGQPSNADDAAKNSGFTDQNSGLGPAGTTLGGNDTTINGAATNAVNNANTSLQRPTLPPTPPPMPPAAPPRGPGN
jgi:hypothetical protein